MTLTRYIESPEKKVIGKLEPWKKKVIGKLGPVKKNINYLIIFVSNSDNIIKIPISRDSRTLHVHIIYVWAGILLFYTYYVHICL